MDVIEQQTACKSCAEKINSGQIISFASNIWHPGCFRCFKCQRTLTHDSSLLILSTGDPICESCGYVCAKCRLPIREEAIMTGEEAYHGECFRCVECGEDMAGDLVYARLESGELVCGKCHPEQGAVIHSHRPSVEISNVGPNSPVKQSPVSPSGNVGSNHELRIVKAKLIETEAALEKLKAASKSALAEFAKTKQLLATEQQQRLSLETQLAKLSKSGALGGEVDQLKNQLKQLADRKREVEKEVAVLERRSADLKAEHERLVQQNRQRQNEQMQSIESQLASLNAQHQEMTSQISTLAILKSTMQVDVDAITEEKGDLVREMAQLRKDVEQLRKEKAGAQRDVERWTKERERTQKVGNLNEMMENIAVSNSSPAVSSHAPGSTSVSNPVTHLSGSSKLVGSKAIGGSMSSLAQQTAHGGSGVTVNSMWNSDAVTLSDNQLYGSSYKTIAPIAGSLKSPISYPENQPNTARSGSNQLTARPSVRVPSFVAQPPKLVRVVLKKESSTTGSNTILTLKEVPKHHMAVQTFLVPAKCGVCGDKIWGVKAKDYQCRNCGMACHVKCLSRLVNECGGNGGPSKEEEKPQMFGNDLDHQTTLEGRMVPYVVEKCAEAIEARGLDSEGIYRKSGLQSQIRQLIETFNQSEDHGRSIQLDRDTWPDVNVISGVMKQYFRMLPRSLVTSEVYGAAVNAAMETDEREKKAQLIDVLARLPGPHYETLKYLTIHLNKVAASSKVNLMHSRNLAVVFGPNLLRSPNERDFSANPLGAGGNTATSSYSNASDGLGSGNSLSEVSQQLGDMGYKNAIVEYLIDQCDVLFYVADLKRSRGDQVDVPSVLDGIDKAMAKSASQGERRKSLLERKDLDSNEFLSVTSPRSTMSDESKDSRESRDVTRSTSTSRKQGAAGTMSLQRKDSKRKIFGSLSRSLSFGRSGSLSPEVAQPVPLNVDNGSYYLVSEDSLEAKPISSRSSSVNDFTAVSTVTASSSAHTGSAAQSTSNYVAAPARYASSPTNQKSAMSQHPLSQARHIDDTVTLTTTQSIASRYSSGDNTDTAIYTGQGSFNATNVRNRVNPEAAPARKAQTFHR